MTDSDGGSSIHTKAKVAWEAIQPNSQAIPQSAMDPTTPALGHLLENTTTGDEGIDCTGEFHVGAPGAGREMVVGEGDSHTAGMVVFTATSGGTVYADVTEEAASGSGSVFNPFPASGSINDAFYVGADTSVQGLKVITANTGTPVSIDVAREYWNGSAWAPFKMCVTDADYPYEQRADDAGTVVGPEQWRFSTLTNHTKNTINGVEKYWIRYRVTAGSFSTAAETEQIKLHTNRWECNADGFTEYFGQARYRKELTVHWGLTQALTGITPSNENVQFSTNITLTFVRNRLVHTVVDGFGGTFQIPEGLDTSKDVEVEFRWYPIDNTTAGDVQLEFKAVQVPEGATIGALAEETETQTETVVAGTQGVTRSTTFLIDVQNLKPGDEVVFALRRLTTGNTYATGVPFYAARAVGIFWHP